jgi:glycerol-3-phosphate dehydrogenase (NAD(P)+)
MMRMIRDGPQSRQDGPLQRISDSAYSGAIMRGKRRQKIGILGGGAWGTAIGKLLAEQGFRVEIWCFEEEVARAVNREHSNPRYLMGVALPDNLKATSDLMTAAAKKDYLIIAVPSPYLLGIVRRMLAVHDIIEGRTRIALVTKGFVEADGKVKLLTDAVEDYLPGKYKGNLVYLSGPSHAEEVARGKITGLISASASGTTAIRFRKLFSGTNLIVFSSLDVKGVQISAAVKNVIAIAFGMLDALAELSERFGDNTEALLLAAGLNEIQRLGLAMGATHAETFASIAGVGDLEVTCRSRYGRNRRLGREIIMTRLLDRFQNIDDLIDHINDLGYLAEGAVAARYVQILSREYGVVLPICRGVYQVLNREVPPQKVVENILQGIVKSREIAASYFAAP